MIWYFNVFVSAAFVFMRRHLTTGDIQLFHQLTGQPATHFHAGVRGHDSRYVPGAGRAATGMPRLHDLAALSHALTVRLIS